MVAILCRAKNMRTTTRWIGLIAVVTTLMVRLIPAANAADRTWQGNAGGNWFAGDNWSPVGYPQAGESVDITNGSVLLTNSTAILASLTITNASLIFSNWTTRLLARNITIQSGGILTLPVSFTTSQMSNRVWVVCTNLTVEIGGSINVDAKGYSGSAGSGGWGPGVGGHVSGGGYGGKGGDAIYYGVGGSTYGSTSAPDQPGSGGGGDSGWTGAAGGGLVRIEASGNVVVDGTITANGGTGNGGQGSPLGSSGGSGGGIYIVCTGTFSGATSGLIRAAGGGSSSFGAGGGGRIAIECPNLVGENVKVRFSTIWGVGGGGRQPGIGTLYLSNTNLLSETLAQFDNLQLIMPGFTNWNVANLTISNRVVSVGSLDNGAIRLGVANNLTVNSGGLGVGGVMVAKGVSLPNVGPASNPIVTVGGNVILNGGDLTLGCNGSGSRTLLNIGTNLTLTNSATLSVYASVTNASTTNGAVVTVPGRVSVGSASWIYPYAHPTNGGSVLFQIGTLVLLAGGGMDADGKGYASERGPGTGQHASGAGYGGKGGDYLNGDGNRGGNPYGSSNAPIDPGSGGGEYETPGAGGGLVRIETSGDTTVNGTITANGAAGTSSGSGGSGGGIYLVCAGGLGGGVGGILRANGAYGAYGGGGGGRIAVWIGVPAGARQNYLDGIPGKVIASLTPPTNQYPGAVFFTGACSVTNGDGPAGLNNAAPGTVRFFSWPQFQGSVMTIR